MSKKEFWVEVSFSGRVKMLVEAEDVNEAKEKVFELGAIDIEHPDCIDITEIEWDLIEEAPSGNVGTPFVNDMYIEEEE